MVLLAAHALDVNILIWTSRKTVDHGTNDRVMVHGDGTRADGRRSGFFAHIRQTEGSRRALDCRIDGVCGTGDYTLLDLPRETSRSRSAPEKSVQFGPDGAPFPSKTSITRGPPVVAVAVSLDPILPQR